MPHNNSNLEKKSSSASAGFSEDASGYTLEGLHAAITRADEQMRFSRELGDDVLETSFLQERRRLQAELARRNGTKPPGASEAKAQPIIRHVSEIAREEIVWLWPDRIPIGKLTLLEGDPGLGKSWLTLAIAAAVTRGWALPGGSLTEPHSVLLLNAEDGASDTIRPRLEDLEADLGRVVLLEGARENGKDRAVTLADLDVIEAAIAAHGPALVIVDPLVAYTAQVDTHVAAEVRGLLAPLASLAERCHVAVLAVRHLTKSPNAKAAYRGQGSIDFLAACRSAFLVAEHPDVPTDRVFCHIKSNLAPKVPSLRFTIQAGRFLWGEEVALTAEQLLAEGVPAEERTEIEEAKDFLRDALGGGPLPSAELLKLARSAGIAERTLKRAKSALGVRAKKSTFGGGWICSLRLEEGQGVHTQEYGLLRESSDSLITATDRKIRDNVEAHQEGHSEEGQRSMAIFEKGEKPWRSKL